MAPSEITALPARVTAERLASSALTAAAVAEAWLEAVSARESEVRAFAHLDPGGIRADARRLDGSTARRGPLHGIPLGVKDIMETVDQPTGFGSPIYGIAHQGVSDAACVALAREAGAVVFGKTVTTEFATYQPGKTRNPHNLNHTPGGSSSGSAAAVAAGMLPLAFGTQTAGSVIRPAAFCGVVGYKPSFGLIPRAGVKSLAESLDTVGVFARDVADAAFAVGGLMGRPSLRVDATSGPDRGEPLRVGLCRSPAWLAAAPETVALWDDAAIRLAEPDGVEVTEVTLPSVFGELIEAQRDLMDYEAARSLAFERTRHWNQLSAPLHAMLDRGWAIPSERYDACRVQIARAGAALSLGPRGPCDVLLTPSAPGEAPAGLGMTGDPVFNRIWTALGLPCVHLPLARGPRGLPLGLQVVGPFWGDAATLLAAHRLHLLLSR